MKTLNALIQSTNIPESLVRAVVRQLGGWQSFKESAPDIANHGIDGGFSGFINYTDTVKFAKRHKVAIMELAEQMASDIGEGGAFELIAGFNCLRNEKVTQEEIARAIYQGKGEFTTSVLNALAWFAGEEVARAYANE